MCHHLVPSVSAPFSSLSRSVILPLYECVCPLVFDENEKERTKSIGRITPTRNSQNIPAKESNKSKQPDVEQARASPTN
jgi:hypothetical protein